MTGRTYALIGGRILALLVLLLIVAAICAGAALYAEDVKSASASFAEQSFALLDQLSKQGGDTPNPLMAPVASFAGDADSLRRALANNHLQSANSDIASLRTDATAVDQALKQHPNAGAAERWSALRQQLDKLAKAMPAVGSSHPYEGKAGEESSVSAPPLSAIGDSPVLSDTDKGEDEYAPRIVISSRANDGGYVRLKGYFEGRALKSAGIYEGSNRLKAFQVDRISGRQRVDFDLRFEDPTASTVIRVADADDRTAEVPVLDQGLQPPASPDLASEATPPIASDAGETAGSKTSTIEIPSHGGRFLPSPSKRHTIGSKLANVQIDISSVTRTANLPPRYEIAGQIAGGGITRAGIYLDGRLLRPIPVMHGARSTSFDQQIVAQGGTATIRAYSVGDQFVEQSVNLSDAEDSAFSDARGGAFAPLGPMPTSGIAVQITGVRPVAGNLYVVSGIISGTDIASAGLYQNGVLAQNINLGRLGGVLGAFIPGSSRTINFNARFNPYAGPAVIRAFDSTGAYTEQPIMVAGMSPGPRWPNSTYSGAGSIPLGRGRGTGPYGNAPGPIHPAW